MSILREYQMPRYSFAEQQRRKDELKRREEELAKQRENTFIDLVNKNFNHPVDLSIEQEIYDPKNHIAVDHSFQLNEIDRMNKQKYATGEVDRPEPKPRMFHNDIYKNSVGIPEPPSFGEDKPKPNYRIPTTDELRDFREETGNINPDIYPDYRYGYGSSSPVLHPYSVPKNSTQTQRAILPRQSLENLPELTKPGTDWDYIGRKIGNFASTVGKTVNPGENIPDFTYENESNKEVTDNLRQSLQINDLANTYRQNRELMETIAGMGFNVENLDDEEIVSLGQQILPKQLEGKEVKNVGNEYVRATGGSSSGGGLSPYQELKSEEKYVNRNQELQQVSDRLNNIYAAVNDLPEKYFGGALGGLAYKGGLAKWSHNLLRGLNKDQKQAAAKFQSSFNDLAGIIRHERFGSALTATEKAAFQTLFDGDVVYSDKQTLIQFLNDIKNTLNHSVGITNELYGDQPFYQKYLKQGLVNKPVTQGINTNDENNVNNVGFSK